MIVKCMTPECLAAGHTDFKGLCSKCYRTAKRLVASGQTTWAKLERLGLVSGGGPVADDAFMKAFKDTNKE